jgi:hypothetical protein
MCILLMHLLDIKCFGNEERMAGIVVSWGKEEKLYF